MGAEITLGPLGLSGTDDDGVEWVTSTFDVWGGTASTLQVTQKPTGSGGWAGPVAASPRTLAVAGTVGAGSATQLWDAIDRLNAACSLEETPLHVTEDDVDRWCMVQRQDVVLVTRVNQYVATWSLQLTAADSRWFADPQADETGLPSATGGLTVPFTVPFSIDETVISGAVSLTNPGNTAGPVVVRVDGPCTGPIITHTGSGKRLVLGTELALAQGEFLTIDMENEVVLAQGQSRRNGWVIERGWANFDPGVNTWAFTSQGSYNSLARMSVVAWPSWQ